MPPCAIRTGTVGLEQETDDLKTQGGTEARDGMSTPFGLASRQ